MDVTSEAITYIKDRYSEEQSLFNHIENKCSKLITFLTILIGAFTSIVAFSNTSILSPSSKIEWILLVNCIITFFVFSCSWGHALLALKMDDCPSATNKRENAEYLFSANEKEFKEQIFRCYVDTTEELVIFNDRKAKNLEHSYNELTYGAWLLAIFISITLLKELLK